MEIKWEVITHYNKNDEYEVFTIMEKEGRGMIRVFHDFKENIAFISDLSVNKFDRQKGLGSELLSSAEDVSNAFKVDFMQLRVKKGSWMFDWYKRLGYKFLYEDSDGYNFMIKEI